MAAKKQKKQTSEIGRLTNTVERGFAALAEDIGKLDAKIDKVEERLENRLDKLDAEIDSAETNLAGKLTRVCVARRPMVMDFSCGFQPYLSSGTRSSVRRVLAIS